MTNATEEWRTIPFRPKYEASNIGRIRAAESGKILAQRLNKCGYMHTALYWAEKGNIRLAPTHRLVMCAFVGPCPEGMEVNHKDGDRTNNTLENLEYITHLNNVRHGWSRRRELGIPHPLIGRKRPPMTQEQKDKISKARTGIPQPWCRVSEEKQAEVRELRKQGLFLREIKRISGVSLSAIDKILNHGYVELL